MAATSTPALDDLHRRIGRNFLRFQQIEFALKFVLPYMHPDAKTGPEAFRRYRERIRVKPLGDVIRAFEESCDVPRAFFDEKLKDVVDARNQLVHHLFELPGIDLMDPGAQTDLASYLDRQYAAAAELCEFTRLVSGAALLAIHDSSPGAHPELEALSEKLKVSLPEITVVDSVDEEQR